MSIPKIIHLIWIGDKPLNNLAKRSLASFKKYYPDYKIKLWSNEDFDYKSPLFVQYKYNKKEWAFLNDYLRIKVLYDLGGVYFDLDVEALKKSDILLNPFIGFEKYKDGTFGLNMGSGMAAYPNDPVLKEMLDYYTNLSVEEIKNNVFQPTNMVFKRHGLIDNNSEQFILGYRVLPCDYVAPLDFEGNVNITPNTISIHNYLGTWKDPYITIINDYYDDYKKKHINYNPKQAKICIWLRHPIVMIKHRFFR